MLTVIIQYNPDSEPEVARKLITQSVVDAFKELDLKKSLIVQKAVEALGYDGFIVLAEASQKLSHPPSRTMREALGYAAKRSTISRLLDMGLLNSKIPQFSPDTINQIADLSLENFFAYALTPFGIAVRDAALVQLGFATETLAAWEEFLSNNDAGDNT